MIFRFAAAARGRRLGRARARALYRAPASPENLASGPAQESHSRAKVTDSNPQLLPLSDLPQGMRAIIHEIHLAASAAEQVMLFGFMKGVEVVAGECGPGGCPRVYRLDGTEVAIRRATARRILVRIPSQEPA